MNIAELVDFAIIVGRPCVVVGAAPCDRVVPEPGERVLAVNGGISSVDAPNVDLWLLNARKSVSAWGRQARQLHELMLAQGKGYTVGLALLLVREDEADTAALDRLATLGATVQSSLALEHVDRLAIETAVGGRTPAMTKHALSAGLTGVCLALLAGASKVRMAGFSWTGGYAYTDEPIRNRGHIRGDLEALTLLTARYGDRLVCSLDLSAPLPQRSPMETTPTTGLARGTSPRAARARNGQTAPPLLPRRDKVPGEPLLQRDKKAITKTVQKAFTAALVERHHLSHAAAAPLARAMRIASTPTAAPRQGATPMKVRAKEMLFHNMRRYRAGDVFVLRTPGDFKQSCMERVADDTPTKATTPAASQREAHQQIVRGKGARLKPNAADLEDEPVTADATKSPIAD